MAPPPLIYTGHVDFRMRLVLATLSGRAIKIEKIRSDDMEPGLKGEICSKIFAEEQL